ncbi:MAG TPA: hypothetical protein VFN11_00745 [Ktedonobacterales bacterium]|nr:hypothetical protein [Ktedonobacterales bacterium]
MGEPRARIRRGNRVKRRTNRLPSGLVGARAQPAYQGFALRERLLNRREVGRGGRQEEQRAAYSGERMASAWRMLAAVCTLKLASTTPCPGRSVGPSCSALLRDVPQKGGRIHRLIVPSISQGTRSPSGVKAATNVV